MQTAEEGVAASDKKSNLAKSIHKWPDVTQWVVMFVHTDDPSQVTTGETWKTFVCVVNSHSQQGDAAAIYHYSFKWKKKEELELWPWSLDQQICCNCYTDLTKKTHIYVNCLGVVPSWEHVLGLTKCPVVHDPKDNEEQSSYRMYEEQWCTCACGFSQ